jgi:hypothetical protein
MTYCDDHSYPSNDVPQKPVTEAMLSTAHGTHNYEEYRRVLSASSGCAEGIHFWARYGVLRILHRTSSWLHAALRFNSSNLPEDEYEHGLDYLRAVNPMQREFSEAKDTIEAFVLAVSDYAAIERLLVQPVDTDQDVLYWARRGVTLGLESWRHMTNMITTGRIQPIEMDIPCPDLTEFMERSDLLLNQYKTAGAGQ